MIYDKKLNYAIALISMYPHKFGKILNQAGRPGWGGASEIEIKTYLSCEFDRFFLELIHQDLIPDKPYEKDNWFWDQQSLSLRHAPGVRIEISISIQVERFKGMGTDYAKFKMRISDHEGLYIEVLEQIEGFGYKDMENEKKVTRNYKNSLLTKLNGK